MDTVLEVLEYALGIFLGLMVLLVLATTAVALIAVNVWIGGCAPWWLFGSIPATLAVASLIAGFIMWAADA